MFNFHAKNRESCKNQELFEYYHLHIKLGDIFDTVYLGYTENRINFLKPNQYFIDLYKQLIFIFLELEHRKEIIDLPLTDIRFFSSLAEDFKLKISSWSRIRESFLEDSDFLERIVDKSCKIPINLQVLFHKIDFTVNEHNKKKIDLLKLKSVNKYDLSFGAKKSKRRTVYEMLFSSKGEWVKVTDISKRINTKPYEVRIIINQLKEKIIDQRKEKYLHIESSGQSSYRLINS